MADRLAATDEPPSLEGLAEDRRSIDVALGRLCDHELARVAHDAPDVARAIRYALQGGKRFRGTLFLAAFRAAGGRGDASELAAAIEVVHAYSLVHDDLPCMDDDDIRRGRPTAHRVVGVRTASVAGITMVPLAALGASRGTRALGCPSLSVARLVTQLMRASGASGMIGGQLLDLSGEGRFMPLEEMEQIHRAKTGALIAAAALLGGVAAGAGDRAVDALGRYGAALGLAFQIADDVLDVTATTDVLGKTAGKDRALGKSTYVALLGVDGARSRALTLVERACRALAKADLLTPVLERIAHFVVRRTS